MMERQIIASTGADEVQQNPGFPWERMPVASTTANEVQHNRYYKVMFRMGMSLDTIDIWWNKRLKLYLN